MPDIPLSIGIVSAALSRSGGGIFPIVRAHAKGLAALPGKTVTVYGLSDADLEKDLETWTPIKPRAYHPLMRRFGFAPRLSVDLKQARHDVVHQHGLWLYPSIAVARWRRQSGKPTVISTQGMLEPWAIANSPWKKRIAAALFERDNLVHASCIHCSESEVAGIRGYGLKNPIAVVSNGVEMPTGSATPPPRPGWMGPESRATLLFLGRLHPKKGIRELLEAWANVRATSPAITSKWLLAIAGWDEGGHAAELRHHASRLSLSEENVVFPGPLFGDEKSAALFHANAFVLPSHSEGLPMAVLEAWSYGVPVLMTRACNLPIGFEFGAAIEIDTQVDTLARTLTGALGRDDLEAIGERGRELVLSRFDWPIIIGQISSVYEWLVGGGSRPSCVHID